MATRIDNPHQRTGWALVFVLAIAVVLRLVGLGHQSYWIDEYASIVMAYDGLFSGFSQIRSDVHPPLYFTLLHFWIRAFGDAETTVRLLSVVPSVLMVVFLYRLGKRLFGAESGLLAAVLAAASLLQIYYAQEARSYAWLMLFVVLSYDALVRWQIKGQRKDIILYAIFSTAIVYTHYFGLFVIAAQAAYVLFVALGGERRARGSGFALALLAVAVCAAFWLPVFLEQFERVQEKFWIGKPEISGLLMLPPLFLSWWGPWSGNSAGGTWVASWGATAFAFFSVALVAGVAGRNRKRSTEAGHQDLPGWEALLLLFFWLVLPASLAVRLSAIDIDVFTFRNTVVSAPAMLLLAAAACARLRQPVARALLLAALLAPSLAQMPDYYRDLHKDHWRQAAAYVGSDFNFETDAFVFDAAFVRQVFDFYVELPRYRVIPLFADDEFSGERIWLVRAYAGPFSKSPDTVAQWGYEPVEHWKGNRVEVFLFSREAEPAGDRPD